MSRIAVVAIAGIAVLMLTSFVIIAVVTRDTTGGSTGRVDAASSTLRDPRAPADVPVQAGPGSPLVDGMVAASAPPAGAPAAPALQPDPWASIVPVERADEMGDVGPAFAAALSESLGALGRCFEESSAAKDAVVTHDLGGSERRPPVLLLELETTYGGARIVDAPVGIRGAAGDDVILCAQRIFRGMWIDAPGVPPGSRYRMRYALVQ